MTHFMKLKPLYFSRIKCGKKTIELRLYDEKRQKIKVDDTIEFTNTEDGERLETQVVALHRFDSFEQLYASLPLLKCGYTEDNVHTARPEDMSVFYSENEQAMFGVVGIEIRVIK